MRTVDALKPLTAGELLELWRYYRETVSYTHLTLPTIA